MGKGPFTIVIEGEKLRIEREITRKQLATIISWPEPDELEEEETEVPGASAASEPEVTPLFGDRPSASPADRSRPEMSFGEFARELDLSNNFQRIAAICAYNEDHLGKRTTDRDGLKGGFRRGGWPIPKNLGRDLKKAIGRGLIDEDHDDPDTYWVTSRGRELLGIELT